MPDDPELLELVEALELEPDPPPADDEHPAVIAVAAVITAAAATHFLVKRYTGTPSFG